MGDFESIKQEIPILTGPGSFFIALLIFALFCTSNKSQQLLFNWEFIGALVLLSVPLSVFFIQVYHGYAILIGYKRWDLGTEYEQFHDHKHRLVCMMDYLSWKGDQETINEWTIIYRKAEGRNLFGTLFFTCVCF